MAAVSTIVAVGALAVSAGSAYMGYQERKDAQRAQKKAQSEQKARNAAEAAAERRRQIREERVKRARILQSSENTGTTNSSGALGALSSLSSQFGTNVGMNLGRLRSADNISIFNQKAADSMASAENWGAVQGLSTQLFSASGGFGAIKDAWNRNTSSDPLGDFMTERGIT